MKVMVSACLMGKNCKYNGKNNYSNKVADFVKDKEVVLICPEQLGGLPTPRVPAEIVNGRVINADGEDVNKEFTEGAKKAFDIALSKKVDMAILQSRSPSCGSKQVYDGTFSGQLIEGKGIFADMLIKNGIKVIDAEDVI